MTAAALLQNVKRFAAWRRRHVPDPVPRYLIPQLIPATKKHEPLIQALWNIPLGEAKALLPVSTNGKRGKAKRTYFVVKKVERFLEDLPTEF